MVPFLWKGKPEISDDCHIWEASPILCFQNDLSSESALEVCDLISMFHKKEKKVFFKHIILSKLGINERMLCRFYVEKKHAM